MNPKLKELQIDFDSLKVGDKVWHIYKGYVNIEQIIPFEKYCIVVDNMYYLKNGNEYNKDIFPALWKSNPFDLISEYPKEMMVNRCGEWGRELIVCKVGDYCITDKAERVLSLNVKEIKPEPKKEITIKQKKIIGYKAPYDLFGGIIKNGELFRTALIKGVVVYLREPFIDEDILALPKEFVEKEFIPVYKEERLEILDFTFWSSDDKTVNATSTIRFKGKLTQEIIDKIKKVI